MGIAIANRKIAVVLVREWPGAVPPLEWTSILFQSSAKGPPPGVEPPWCVGCSLSCFKKQIT